MAEIDDELIARALRWCAEAGRQAAAADVRAALTPLSWDELLAARALLADPPPARPLGPRALADMARGTAPEIAAERQREGQYTEERGGGAVAVPVEAPAAAAIPALRARGRRKRSPAQIVIRRARDRPEQQAPPLPPALPSIDELHRAEGRTVLEQLVRRHGARRARVLAALADGWRHTDGSAPGPDDLAALLHAHGLARAFERRERDEAIHAVRAAGGMLGRAAASLGVDREALPALLERVGAAPEVAAIRAHRRDELRRRATLSERARLLCEESDRLADLDLLGELEDDLRVRLPELLRALRATSGKAPLMSALADSLSLPRIPVEALVRRLGIDLTGAAHASGAPAAPPPARRAEAAAGDPRPLRKAPPRAGGPSPADARVGGSRPPIRRPVQPGAASDRRPRGKAPPTRERRVAGGRPPSARPGGPRTGAPRPGTPRPAGAARTGPPRTGPPRTGPPRPSGRGAGKPRRR